MSMIRRETADDIVSIREVHRSAFERDEEGRLVDLLRREGYVRLSLVAEVANDVVGHILFSDLPVVTEGGRVQALSLAPLAVLPSHQKSGIGSLLVREGLQVCAHSGHRIVIVLGHPAFYPRFGFSAQLAERLRSPYAGPNFMALELQPGTLDGVEGKVQYPPPFELF
jgi:putative acetyltransferase